MSRGWLALLLLVPALVLAQAPPPPKPSPSPSPAAEPAPTFPSQVELVTVDVVVTDKKGNPIPDLTKDEMQIAEDGAAQTITSFETILLSPEPAPEKPGPRPFVSTNTDPHVRTARTFVVVFDDIHLTPFMALRAKGAVGEFLKNGVREGDRVSVVATGGGAWWSEKMMAGRDALITLVKRLDGRHIPDTGNDRITDYEAMRIHMYRDAQVQDRVRRRFDTYGVNPGAGSNPSSNSPTGSSSISGGEDPYVSARASEVYFAATTKNRITLETLERILNALGTTKGRKSIILVSEGFIYDPNLDEFKRVLQAARRSNVAVYFLDARGLEGMPLAMTAQFGPPLAEQDIGSAFMETVEASEGAESVAADSGGFTVRNTNDLGKGIQRIADELRAYYLLGYNPTNAARDGKFRKISVKLIGRKGLQVRARKGYYAATDAKPPARKPGTPDPVIQRALDSPYEEDAIPLRMAAYVMEEKLLGKAAVQVATDVDVRGFAFEEKEGRLLDSLELLLVVAHRESGEYFRYDQNVEMRLFPQTREKLAKSWYPLVRDFELPAGGYQAKVVIRDKNSGRVGTLIHEFEVPDTSQFRISTPILSDIRQVPPDGGLGGPLGRLARRGFAKGATVFCDVEVHGAAKDPKSGMPRVTMGYVVRGPDGSNFRTASPTPIGPTSLGKLLRRVGFSLEDAAPGEYEMVISLKDELSGKTLEDKQSFAVEPASEG
ncbi:MAG TPA: VWA domain-containing protein [Vicinamibacteria bacterium]|nr:VWA domain-containing protein [Vicinamibacteria bacterium]